MVPFIVPTVTDTLIGICSKLAHVHDVEYSISDHILTSPSSDLATLITIPAFISAYQVVGERPALAPLGLSRIHILYHSG